MPFPVKAIQIDGGAAFNTIRPDQALADKRRPKKLQRLKRPEREHHLVGSGGGGLGSRAIFTAGGGGGIS